MKGNRRCIVTSTKLINLPQEVQDMLNEYVDIVLDDLPPLRNISQHINLILGENIPIKAIYMMVAKEDEEIKKRLQE